MRPAFSSTRQAAAFALLLLALLLLPAVMGKNLLPPREQAYSAQGWNYGPYPWIHHEIFEEQGDIDIVFVGSSLMMWGIDTPYVQAQMSAKLGRPAVVRTITWGGTGYDALYFITKDLLEHRRVRLLVFYDEDNRIKGYRNIQAPVWFRFGDDAETLAGLPLPEKGFFYFASVIGIPRNLLSWVRPNFPAELLSSRPNYMETAYNTPNPASRLGSVSARIGCTLTQENTPFVLYEPQGAARPADFRLYSPATKESFQFGVQPLPPWQLHFAQKFAKLAEEQGCRLLLLHIPQIGEMRSDLIQERAFWPEVLAPNVMMLGVPPAKLFASLSDEEVYRLYANSGQRNNVNAAHFNQNGQEFFTRLITPSLLEIYEHQVKF